MERYRSLRFQEALEIALEVARKFPEIFQGEISLGIACIYAKMGRLDEAVHILEKALSHGHWWTKSELTQIPALLPLRERPDFVALVQKCDSLQQAAQASSPPKLLVFEPHGGAISNVLMIALHGRGETAHEFAPLWKAVVETGLLLAVPVSSQPFRSEGPCWDDHQKGRMEIADVFSRLQASNNRRFNQTIMAGYSQGGELALSLALNPAFPCDGFIVVSPGPFSRGRLEEFTDALEPAAHHGLRGWIFSGDRDPTYTMTRNLSEKMQRHNLRCQVTVEAGLGHSYPSNFEGKLVSAVKFVTS